MKSQQYVGSIWLRNEGIRVCLCSGTPMEALEEAKNRLQAKTNQQIHWTDIILTDIGDDVPPNEEIRIRVEETD